MLNASNLSATAVTRVLDHVRSPADLRGLKRTDLEQLCAEIRSLIREAVGCFGGHLASNLGLVETTVALHSVFDFKQDRLLWDVGHQAYVHKILTGRAEALRTGLRCGGGISGFPSPAESEYDLFSVGHAGTAVATACGMALGDSLLGQNHRRVVSIVGDASIINGVAIEGLNNAGKLKRQFLVVLNDNGMSIDVAQGALAEYLGRFRSSHFYEEVKRKAKQHLRKLPGGETAYSLLDHLKEGIKAAVSPHQFFEQLGFMYIGPTDGHDLPHLIHLLEGIADVQQPILLHIQTEKGRGYSFACKEPTKFHSPSAFSEDEEGTIVIKKSPAKAWTTAFADAMIERMAHDPRIAVLTAAMPDGTGLSKIREKFPERSLDCGIAESATTDIAAGMCRAGLRPVAAIYSTFMQRAFDQAFQECSLQGLPVVFALDRAGLVGEDGAVHHGFLDIAFLRGLPGFHLCAPADEPELAAALAYALDRTDGPTALRYPRDNVPATPYAPPEQTPTFEPGKARLLRPGADAALLCYGTMCAQGLAAADLLADAGVDVAVYNMRFAKPIDSAVLNQWLPSAKPVFTVEDHSITGGFGSAVLEAACQLRLPTQHVSLLGMPAERYVHVETRKAQLALCGLDPAGIARSVREQLRIGQPSADAAPASTAQTLSTSA